VFDLIGLIVLLSADVPCLSFLTDYVPGARYRKKMFNRIKDQYSPSAINPDLNVLYQPMFDLTGKEALAILELFSVRRTRLAPLVSVVRSLEDNPGQTGFPDRLVKIVLSKDANDAGLARPLPRSELERLAEKRLHDRIYSWGFGGMFVGALLQIFAVFIC
jgi:hypothetical protein